jgi:predicted nucleic-acid-binding protein
VIGIDTNILLRLVLRDDPAQTARAEALLSNVRATGEKVFLADAVLLEFVWVLEGKGFDRAQLTAVLEVVVGDPSFTFVAPADIRAVLHRYASYRVDFADCLIAERAASAGCTATYSFDGPAQRGLGFRAP